MGKLTTKLLGHSSNANRLIEVVYYIQPCVFCDGTQGVELLLKAAHKNCWGSYKGESLRDLVQYRKIAIAELMRNFQIKE